MSRIIVKNLPANLSEDGFKTHFAKHLGASAITDVKLIRSRTGDSRRFGFIGFKSPEDAKNACSFFNNTFLNMSKINVELAKGIDDSSLPLPSRVRNKNKRVHEESNFESKKLKLDQNDTTSNNNNVKDENKLNEFIQAMKPRSSIPTWANDDFQSLNQSESISNTSSTIVNDNEIKNKDSDENENKFSEQETTTQLEQTQNQDDEDEDDEAWLRKRKVQSPGVENHTSIQEETKLKSDTPTEGSDTPKVVDYSQTDQTFNTDEETAVDQISKSKRIFLRNLPYSVTESDLSDLFSKYGPLQEVHVSIDVKTGIPKGFAYLLFENSQDAIEAFQKEDKQSFQGRLLHLIPAKPKRENKMDEIALKSLPFKRQKELKRKAEAAKGTFSWNSLFMNPDAVVASMADKMGISKSELLDPTSSDAAVRQALSEAHVINDARTYFESKGVNLDAFKNSKKSDTVILVKNFAYGTTIDELTDLFSEYGDLHRVLIPPSGTIAIVEFLHAPEARAAFTKLAFKRFKSSILYLEKAPENIISASALVNSIIRSKSEKAKAIEAVSAQDILSTTGSLTNEATNNETVVEEGESVPTTSVFVKNLNFKTSSVVLTNAFKTFEGFVIAQVKYKPDPKKSNSKQSMGFGFVEFNTRENALKAIKAMDGFVLDGHKLQVKASNKGADAAAERSHEDLLKKKAMKNSKIVIKNLPFEASKKDVRNLFGAYGSLRSVRVPKKFDSSSRGFAFAEFTSAQDAANAIKSLSGTHLLGRRLVLDYASADSLSAEEELKRMQNKVKKQVASEQLSALRLSGKRQINLEEDANDFESL